MFRLNITISPKLRKIEEFMLGVEQEAIKDLQPFWKKRATPLVIEEMARIFATEGYGTWPKLSPKYARYKRKYFPGKKMLRKSDLYYKAATRRGAGNIRKYEPGQMIWGIDLGYFASKAGFPYPAAHESGYYKKNSNLPARPVFSTAEQSQVLQNNLVASMVEYLEEIVMKESKKHFGKK